MEPPTDSSRNVCQLRSLTEDPLGWSGIVVTQKVRQAWASWVGSAPGWRQLPFIPASLSRRLSLSWSPPPVFSLATVEELLVDVLAASLAYLLQLLAIRLLWHLLPTQ